MRCEYRDWVIDATPDFSLGQFFAHARLYRVSPHDGVEVEVDVEPELVWCATENEAVQIARRWAFAWILKHDAAADGQQAVTPVTRDNIAAERTGK